MQLQVGIDRHSASLQPTRLSAAQWTESNSIHMADQNNMPSKKSPDATKREQMLLGLDNDEKHTWGRNRLPIRDLSLREATRRGYFALEVFSEQQRRHAVVLAVRQNGTA